MYRFVLLTALFLANVPCCRMVAQEVVVNNVIYWIDEESGTASVGTHWSSSSPQPSGRIVIESSVSYQGKSYPVTSIEEDAFLENKDITSVSIPNSVTSIGASAFSACSSLLTVTLGSGLKAIPEYCFSDTPIQSITIPAKVSSVSADAFIGCHHLESILVNSSNTYFSSVNGLLYDHDKKTLLIFPPGKGTAYSIPSGTISIATEAFVGNEILKSITLPATLARIAENAFEDCIGLVNIEISAKVSDIGYGAFQGCNSLVNIKVDTENQFYEDIAGVLIENGIVLHTFPCGRDGEYSIPSKVSVIAQKAFAQSHLNELTIPSSVDGIRANAFYESEIAIIYCYWDKPVRISEGVFYGSSPTIYVPYKSVANYKQADWWGGMNIQPLYPNSHVECDGIDYQIDFESSTATVISKEGQYRGTIDIPESVYCYDETFLVTAVGDEAFKDCAELLSLSLPPTVKSFGNNAFGGCGSLTTLVYENKTPQDIYNNVFAPIARTCTLYVPFGTLSTYQSTQGWKEFKTIKEIMPKEFVLEGVRYIPDFEQGTVSVGASEYTGDINIPAEIEYGGIRLTVTGIEEMAFRNCVSLESLILPSTIKTIGDYAFHGCANLKELIVRMKTPAVVSHNAIANIATTTDLYVPEGLLWEYRRDGNWWVFNSIVELANSFSISGIDYSVNYDSSLATVVKAVADEHNAITIPQTVDYHHFSLVVNSVDADALREQTSLAALVWHSSEPVPSDLLSSVMNPNFILYVDNTGQAPTYVEILLWVPMPLDQ